MSTTFAKVALLAAGVALAAAAEPAAVRPAALRHEAAGGALHADVTNTCNGFCGGWNGCYCDSVCIAYNDCCSDAPTYCCANSLGQGYEDCPASSGGEVSVQWGGGCANSQVGTTPTALTFTKTYAAGAATATVSVAGTFYVSSPTYGYVRKGLPVASLAPNGKGPDTTSSYGVTGSYKCASAKNTDTGADVDVYLVNEGYGGYPYGEFWVPEKFYNGNYEVTCEYETDDVSVSAADMQAQCSDLTPISISETEFTWNGGCANSQVGTSYTELSFAKVYTTGAATATVTVAGTFYVNSPTYGYVRKGLPVSAVAPVSDGPDTTADNYALGGVTKCQFALNTVTGAPVNVYLANEGYGGYPYGEFWVPEKFANGQYDVVCQYETADLSTPSLAELQAQCSDIDDAGLAKVTFGWNGGCASSQVGTSGTDLVFTKTYVANNAFATVTVTGAFDVSSPTYGYVRKGLPVAAVAPLNAGPDTTADNYGVSGAWQCTVATNTDTGAAQNVYLVNEGYGGYPNGEFWVPEKFANGPYEVECYYLTADVSMPTVAELQAQCSDIYDPASATSLAAWRHFARAHAGGAWTWAAALALAVVALAVAALKTGRWPAALRRAAKADYEAIGADEGTALLA